LELIRMRTKDDADTLIEYLKKDKGLKKWPDGRKLEDVIKHR